MFAFLFLTISVLTTGCENGKDPVTPDEPDEEYLDTLIMGNGSTTPYIKGTFVDFWGKEYWDFTKWDAHIKEMKEIGIKNLIIQFSAYEDKIWIKSNNNYSTEKYENAIPSLFKAAEANKIGVYVGLYFNENYWNYTSNADSLKLHAQRCNNLADDIWFQLKSSKSFAGWYIPHEGAPYYYDTEAKFTIFKNNLINPVANYCRQISNKPVAMSAFFNHDLSSTSTVRTFFKQLGKCNLDLILLQDGIGVGHCDLSDLDSYFKAANNGLYADADFKGAFWADVETFTPQQTPEKFDVVKQKLNTVADYVTNIVIFQYYTDMCPTGPGGNASAALRNEYLNYLPK